MSGEIGNGTTTTGRTPWQPRIPTTPGHRPDVPIHDPARVTAAPRDHTAGDTPQTPDAPLAEDAEIVRVHGPVMRASQTLTRSFGSPWAVFGLAIGTAAWLVEGVVTDYPRSWELSATVGLPILALLALFVVQHTQNHNDRALQLKLDELLRALETADSRLVAVEDVDEQGLHELRATYRNDVDPDPPGDRPRAGFRGSPDG